jgi:geranylgeranyl diphosphate synthase, type I
MSLENLSSIYIPAIEEQMKLTVARCNGQGLSDLHYMLSYHMGWEGPGAGPEARGKRIRPLLVLLVTSACNGQWQRALPAAAAVELLHNFSLIHDDIEDNSPLRRGRPTLWKDWGIPLAINAGDTMFTLANLSVLDLEGSDLAVQAVDILLQTCLHLTQGQHLDISYETRTDLTQEDYWPMIGGKTAALLAACGELGALVAGVPTAIRQEYRLFGQFLGLAFQALDDLLGIWGDSEKTGKSAESDLVSGKKSLPVLYGLSQKGLFAQRWNKGKISMDEVTSVAIQLEKEGAREYTQQQASLLTERALASLNKANPQGEAGEALRILSDQLLQRKT